ncbi:lasso peptide biosynthesis PqqD family chaperone [Streptomyces sioyaensis]|uniref:Lasso peptide biosynthesis PqqD family chaperone n=1 Tax=Streptomyces sioyaensis TaxID=67364 RepID=A0A4Q1R8F4_9ACTN|nr:lasso peptide biosynthesis PqqD family chaperone [Streptomyces sioyaensis]MBM4792951.1 lasso peptide biosynthesis PqqD family chaperone [Streptomyces sioyaensis]RXS69666.1 lasso peptide biosynthesis PqqD family chaperone [Streptomyces sioyaensis]
MALRFGDKVSTAATDYGTVLLDERSGQYWELNPTASLIVTTLLAGGDETAAADALLAEFGIDRTRAEQDVATLVEELRASGLAA